MLITTPHIIFDWGDTVMKDDPARSDAMHLWPKVEAMADARAVLAELARSHVLSIATSAAQSDAAMVRKALARVELDQYFRHVFTAKITGCGKTDPRFWQHILSTLGIEAKAATMVGDHFENDVLAPVAQGMSAIWFNERTSERREGERYRTICGLRELVEERGGDGR